MGRLCYPTKHPGSVLVPRVLGARKLSRCKEGMAHFLPSGYKFSKHYECRGTSMTGAANLSPVTKLMVTTGAVSRYKVDRSQKTVKVYWILIACRCACPGATTITNLSWVQGKSKKCDKQLTHIVRVMLRLFLKSSRKQLVSVFYQLFLQAISFSLLLSHSHYL